MPAASQLELITRREHEDLFPYWREQLADWPKDVFHFRHAKGCTGWSMATQDFIFAELLFRHGQISKAAFRRYWMFNRRVQRWNNLPAHFIKAAVIES